MALSLFIAIKSFLGFYFLTPFEEDLLKRLSDSLEANESETLNYQLKRFTSVRRLTRHLNEPLAHGFTNFYTQRFGRDVSAKQQVERFNVSESEFLLATARVLFDEGEIDVQFWLVNGVFFSIEYRSPQKIYYPPKKYYIDSLTVRPPQP